MKEAVRHAKKAGSEDIGFGPFSLIRHGENLYNNGRLVRLGSRARQILSLLVSRAGEVVSKREFMDAVWPDTAVVEANLAVHIAALRQALGESREGPHYIVNVPGRGYRFVAKVHALSASDDTSSAGPSLNNLPVRLTLPIGRESSIDELDAKLVARTMVTITGPAGVGKTTVALLVGDRRVDRHPDGVWFVDLAPIADPENVCAAVASVLRIDLDASDPVAALVRAIGDRRLMLIIDNCEHVIDAAATMIAALVSGCANLEILGTSRESLKVPGETVYRLAPLDYPPPSMLVGAEEALAYPAVQLLAERAASAMNDFRLTDKDALAAALVCRRLDGMPLAIEFAAALVETFGLAGLAARLDDHLRLLGIDRRGGTARHRSLEAALDWSYQLLDPVEQRVLRRLAIFAGGFTMEAAEAVLPAPGETMDVGTLLAGLSLKSLLTTDITGPDLRFRFLETTRAFALVKLEANGERGALGERHARYYQALLRRLRQNVATLNVDDYAAELDNVRAALRHALGPNGDTDLALSLAAGALPLWFGLSLMTECHARVQEVSARLSPEQRASNDGWDITVATRAAEIFTRGTQPETYAAWSHPIGDTGVSTYSSASITDSLTAWTWNIRQPDYARMMALASHHADSARQTGLESDRIMSAWVMGLSSHHIGDFSAARAHLARYLQIETIENHRVFVSHTGFDRTAGARAMLGATLCLLGDAEGGVAQAMAAEAEGKATSKAMGMCEALMWGCTTTEIALVDPPRNAERLDLLIEEARRHSLDSHRGVGLALKGVGAARAGAFGDAETWLGEGLETLARSHYGPYRPWFVGELAHALGRQGRVVEGLALIATFRGDDINGDAWCTPELLRNEACLFALSGDKSGALSRFDAAIDLARRQNARAWEERAQRDRGMFAAHAC